MPLTGNEEDIQPAPQVSAPVDTGPVTDIAPPPPAPVALNAGPRADYSPHRSLTDVMMNMASNDGLEHLYTLTKWTVGQLWQDPTDEMQRKITDPDEFRRLVGDAPIKFTGDQVFGEIEALKQNYELAKLLPALRQNAGIGEKAAATVAALAVGFASDPYQWLAQGVLGVTAEAWKGMGMAEKLGAIADARKIPTSVRAAASVLAGSATVKSAAIGAAMAPVDAEMSKSEGQEYTIGDFWRNVGAQALFGGVLDAAHMSAAGYKKYLRERPTAPQVDPGVEEATLAQIDNGTHLQDAKANAEALVKHGESARLPRPGQAGETEFRGKQDYGPGPEPTDRPAPDNPFKIDGLLPVSYKRAPVTFADDLSHAAAIAALKPKTASGKEARALLKQALADAGVLPDDPWGDKAVQRFIDYIGKEIKTPRPIDDTGQYGLVRPAIGGAEAAGKLMAFLADAAEDVNYERRVSTIAARRALGRVDRALEALRKLPGYDGERFAQTIAEDRTIANKFQVALKFAATADADTKPGWISQALSAANEIQSDSVRKQMLLLVDAVDKPKPAGVKAIAARVGEIRFDKVMLEHASVAVAKKKAEAFADIASRPDGTQLAQELTRYAGVPWLGGDLQPGEVIVPELIEKEVRQSINRLNDVLQNVQVRGARRLGTQVANMAFLNVSLDNPKMSRAVMAAWFNHDLGTPEMEVARELVGELRAWGAEQAKRQTAAGVYTEGLNEPPRMYDGQRLHARKNQWLDFGEAHADDEIHADGRAMAEDTFNNINAADPRDSYDGKPISYARKIHWKDAESDYEAWRQFGVSASETIDSFIRTVAKNTIMAEHDGPHPSALADERIAYAAELEKAAGTLEKNRGVYDDLVGYKNELMGGAPTVNVGLHSVKNTVKNIITGLRLDRVTTYAIQDEMNAVANHFRLSGMSPFAAADSYIRGLIDLNAPGLRQHGREIADLSGAVSAIAHAEMASRISPSSGGTMFKYGMETRTERFQNAVLELTGAEMRFRAAQRKVALSLAYHLAQEIGNAPKDFRSEYLRQLFDENGVTAAMWKSVKPEHLADKTIGKYLDVNKVDNETARRALGALMVNHSRRVVLAPDFATKKILTLGTKEGSAQRDIVSLFSLFQASGLAMERNVVGGAIRQLRRSPLQGAAQLASIAISNMVAGYVIVQLTNWLNDDPLYGSEHINDPYLWVKVFDKSALGWIPANFMGKMAEQEEQGQKAQLRDAASSLMGPVMGTGIDMWDKGGIGAIAHAEAQGRQVSPADKAKATQFWLNQLPAAKLIWYSHWTSRLMRAMAEDINPTARSARIRRLQKQGLQ